MRNRFSPRTALTIGLCLATGAFWLWSLQATALAPGPLHRNARLVLSEKTVHRSMVERVSAAVSAATLGGASSDQAALATVASQTLDEPEFVAAFGGALDQVQQHVTKGATGPITLDPVLVRQAVQAAAANQPQLAAVVAAAATPLSVSISGDHVPNLEHWADLWELAIRALLAFFGLVLITYGMLRVDHRVWAVGRIGRWSIAVGISTLAVFWVLPRVLLRPLGGWIAVGGAVLQAGDFLVPVGLGLIGVGAVAVISAHRWEVHDRDRMLAVIPRAQTRSGAGASRWESPV